MKYAFYWLNNTGHLQILIHGPSWLRLAMLHVVSG